jgi:hypothetical protein
VDQLEHISLPAWKEAEQTVELMKTYKVSEKDMRMAEFLEKYVALRREETRLEIDWQGPNDSARTARLNRVNTELDSLRTQK